jgi:hypothetical protein
MAAKKRAAKKVGREKAKTIPPVVRSISVASIAVQNLINMVAVFTTSGVVLLSLLLAKHL